MFNFIFVGCGIIAWIVLWYMFSDSPAEAAVSETCFGWRQLVESIRSQLGLGQSTTVTHLIMNRPTYYSSLEDVYLDMKQEGLERLDVTMAIDFSASNEWQGRLTYGGASLHRLHGGKVHNPYQKAIGLLHEALQPVCQSFRCVAYGVEAAEHGDNAVQLLRTSAHCSALTTDDVLSSYNDYVRHMNVASGPTDFAGLIDWHVENRCHRSASPDDSFFRLLIILTDGQISGQMVHRTRQSIIAASRHPVSIALVGIGDGPFHQLRLLRTATPQRLFDNLNFIDFMELFNGKHKSLVQVVGCSLLADLVQQCRAVKMLDLP